ncbi:MAG TPA: hypothetical protein VFB06_05570 [Streptosporangiaceae bacterium]|nr:hypothetical protein [Streptosporangiaceae bacterium]
MTPPIFRIARPAQTEPADQVDVVPSHGGYLPWRFGLLARSSLPAWGPRPVSASHLGHRLGTHWTFQNIEYNPGPGCGLAISDGPVTDVVMTGNGPWTYQDCVRAAYNPDDSPGNPNNISTSDLRPGRGICVHTRDEPVNNPGKTDGGHYVLLPGSEGQQPFT